VLPSRPNEFVSVSGHVRSARRPQQSPEIRPVVPKTKCPRLAQRFLSAGTLPGYSAADSYTSPRYPCNGAEKIPSFEPPLRFARLLGILASTSRKGAGPPQRFQDPYPGSAMNSECNVSPGNQQLSQITLPPSVSEFSDRQLLLALGPNHSGSDATPHKQNPQTIPALTNRCLSSTSNTNVRRSKTSLRRSTGGKQGTFPDTQSQGAILLLA